MALQFSDRIRDISSIQRTEANRGWEWVSGTVMWYSIRPPTDMPILWGRQLSIVSLHCFYFLAYGGEDVLEETLSVSWGFSRFQQIYSGVSICETYLDKFGNIPMHWSWYSASCIVPWYPDHNLLMIWSRCPLFWGYAQTIWFVMASLLWSHLLFILCKCSASWHTGDWTPIFSGWKWWASR